MIPTHQDLILFPLYMLERANGRLTLQAYWDLSEMALAGRSLKQERKRMGATDLTEKFFGGKSGSTLGRVWGI